MKQAHSSVECQGSGACSRDAFVWSMRTGFTSRKPPVRKFHTQKLEKTKLHVDRDTEFKSELHLMRCLSSSSPLKSGFYCRRTTRHLLQVMTTLHIGAGRKWRVNERNNFSHMAKVLLHFNCAAERSRLDLCRWRDNLLLWFLNVPLQN